MRCSLLALVMLGVAAPIAAQATTAAPQVVVIRERNPAAAGLFSFMIPGGGQLYNGQTGKGIAFFASGLFTVGMATRQECTEIVGLPGSEVCEFMNDAGVWAVAFLANSVWSIVHAVETAKRLNAEALAQPSVTVAPTVGTDGRVGVSFSIRR